MRKIIKLFKSGNVCVTGLRGKGKDLLMGNVIARRKKEYISNLNYGNGFIPLDLNAFDINNKYSNFISGNVNKWVSPYFDKDVYISDVGVYFPSQYCNKLNNEYEGFVYYQALSRQVSRNNVHINVQNLNRAWDKIREQSDIYIRCKKCLYIPRINFVIQQVVIYDKYETCLNRMETPRLKIPLFDKIARSQARIYLDQFKNTHGMIKTRWLFYFNKSHHDTYYFEKLLKGENNEKEVVNI